MMSFCCKILTRPWIITHVIHSRSKVEVSLFIKLIISFPLPLTMWFYITRSSDPIQIVRKSVQGLVTWSPRPFFFGAYSGGSGGRPAHFRYVYLILSFVKRGPADDAQASRARHTPPQANLWYIADVTKTSHVWASWARRCFYPGDSILQEGVVAEVPAFLGHVRADETRTHVVHDLLEAGGRDAGRQHVQYHSTRRSYFVVYLLVLRKRGMSGWFTEYILFLPNFQIWEMNFVL